MDTTVLVSFQTEPVKRTQKLAYEYLNFNLLKYYFQLSIAKNEITNTFTRTR